MAAHETGDRQAPGYDARGDCINGYQRKAAKTSGLWPARPILWSRPGSHSRRKPGLCAWRPWRITVRQTPWRRKPDSNSRSPLAVLEKAKKASLDSAVPRLCLHRLKRHICFAISTSDLGLTPFDAGYGPAIFDPDADREIVSIEIERDFDILAV
jgi:hypothetical protein